MIIKKIQLEPFAGSSSRTYTFNDGLNVFLGPNESGKSTFVNALKSVLFINTDLTPAKFKQLMSDYMPIGGGDTVYVALEVFFKDKIYRLEKHWGATKSTRLLIDKGTVYTSTDDIAEKMNIILGLNQGTYDNVLIIRQSSLAETIRAIESEAQASESIQQILRNSKFKMDGVSVPRLKKALEEKLSEYFNHWDRKANRPEGMRDINNEWKKEVGKILSAYYKYRRTEKAFRQAEEYEIQLDEHIKKIECLSSEVKCVEEFVEKFRQAYTDVNRRKTLMLQKELISKEISELLEIQKTWPRYETEKEYLEKELSEMNTYLVKLNEEEKNAEKLESQRAVREKYEKAKKIYSEYLNEKLKLSELQKVTKQDLADLSKASKEYSEYRIKFEAMKLKLKIAAKEDVSFEISDGFNSSKKISLKGGEEHESILSGRLKLENKDLAFMVTSGSENAEQIINKLEAAKLLYDNLLKKHSVETETELGQKAESYKAQYDAAMALANEFKNALGDQAYNDLEKQYEALEEVPVQRPLKEILKNISDIKEKRKDREKDKLERDRSITKWQEKYSSHENVSDLHAEKKIELKRIEKEIQQLKPLPGEFSDIDLFIKDFETKENSYNLKKNELTELKIQRAEFERHQTEYSTKELEIEMREAREYFERVRKEGESYQIIKEELDSILLEIDADTFEPLRQGVAGLLKQLTLNKYNSLSMDEVIPKGIHFNGSKIPVELLSAGTKDILALAVRLAMADFYLQERSGFIIMDDPLVNLDPGRQEVAVDCIKKIAESKQIILLTCHPSHAGLFGNGVVEISGS